MKSPASHGAARPGATPARILIAEDDWAIAGNLHTFLEHHGYAVEEVYSGDAALHRCSVERYDLILLDIGLPRLDGLAFMRRLRDELRIGTPVLVISARSELDDKLAGFESGADDYLTKPFAFAELDARIRALLKRAGGDPDPIQRYGPLAFDASQGEAWVDGVPVQLKPKAALLLGLLMRQPGRLVRRRDIEAALWPDTPPQPDAVRSQVHGLRKALAERGFDGLETVHGVGLRLVL